MLPFCLCLDPRNWSETDVKQWVMTKLNSSGISLDTVCWLSINGLGLCSCSQDDLLKYLRNPAATNIIYSELKKLKNGELEIEFQRNIQMQWRDKKKKKKGKEVVSFLTVSFMMGQKINHQILVKHRTIYFFSQHETGHNAKKTCDDHSVLNILKIFLKKNFYPWSVLNFYNCSVTIEKNNSICIYYILCCKLYIYIYIYIYKDSIDTKSTMLGHCHFLGLMIT